VRPRRNRHELLPANRLAARLDAALVVPGTRSREARLEQVMRREREEARRELALAPDEDLANRRLEIVVDEAVRHDAEVSKRPDVSVEKAGLILARVEPREVAAGVHEPHHEHVRLAPLAADVD